MRFLSALALEPWLYIYIYIYIIIYIYIYIYVYPCLCSKFMILCSSCRLQFAQSPPLAPLYQRDHKSAVGIWVDHDYSDLVISSLGRSAEQMCDATAKQHLISVATESGGIWIDRDYWGLATNSLGHSSIFIMSPQRDIWGQVHVCLLQLY